MTLRLTAAVFLALSGCYSEAVPQPTPVPAPQPAQDAGSHVSPSPDAAPPPPSPYVACVSQEDFPTKYGRLVERKCSDSLGNTYVWGMIDAGLGIACRWRTAADGKQRCLPMNEQSSPDYADDKCGVPVGLVVIGGQYIGISSPVGTVIYHPGATFHGDVFYRDGDGCFQDVSLAFGTLEYARLGTEVPAETFVLR